ncbi:MAG TPA: sugar nucleotide-binding protein [Gemmatimonadaceae bacterium]|nr:sugar nucleotide-binding protein [Gemmatimonadaceae bacterium]
MTRVGVLGERGMLGHTVARFLAEQGCEVLAVPGRFTPATAPDFVRAMAAARADWWVNCVGVAPRAGVSAEQMDAANRVLPEMCDALLPAGVGFVHASTDGVFRPDLPARHVDDVPDAEDAYGESKRRAEAALQASPRCVIIRCSIVGPELGAPRSLLGWLLSQERTVRGFVNHWWNGITTLQWARVAWQAMQSRPHGPSARLLQPGVLPPVTKFDLLRSIARAWDSPIAVGPAEAPAPVLRTLVPNLLCPSLADQLAELRTWYSGVYA